MTMDDMGGGDALAAGTRLEEFELERELGVSGFGVTYLAHDRSLDRQVAIKEYLPRDWGTRGPDGGVRPRSPRPGRTTAGAWIGFWRRREFWLGCTMRTSCTCIG